MRLGLPEAWSIVAFLVIGILDLGVPLWAERPTMTPWHPHHIAERYGLFTIIVLGESVLAATTAIAASRSEAGLTLELTVVAVSALVLLFALWWLYFLEPAGTRLEQRRDLGFLWGYGHFAVFGSLAAVGAGIEVASEAITHAIAASPLLVGYSLAIPVTPYLGVLWLLHVRMGGSTGRRHVLLVLEFGVLLSIPLVGAWLPITWVVGLIAATTAVLVVVKSVGPLAVTTDRRHQEVVEGG